MSLTDNQPLHFIHRHVIVPVLSRIIKKPLKKSSFTLMEIMAVVVITALLSGLGMASFTNMKEKAANREAESILQLIQMAERAYVMEHGNYYPSSGTIDNSTTANAGSINTNLKLSISPVPISNWTILLDSSTAGSEFAKATRTTTGGKSRFWQINFSAASSSTPACNNGGGGYCN